MLNDFPYLASYENLLLYYKEACHVIDSVSIKQYAPLSEQRMNQRMTLTIRTVDGGLSPATKVTNSANKHDQGFHLMPHARLD